MSELSATIRLRPTRIGFLVRPTDMTSVRRIMRFSPCLWGGLYNPIIPVFRSAPKEWRRDNRNGSKGLYTTRGYIRFFEPDVFVESEKGLLQEAGLGSLANENPLWDRTTCTLDEFMAPQRDQDWAEPHFGLSSVDVLRNLYRTEHQFQLRDKRDAIYVKPQRGRSGIVEALFGLFPTQKNASYFLSAYKDVLQPREISASPKAWIEVFRNGANCPLRTTRYKLDLSRRWHDEPVIFIFDPHKPTDLIDLWNIRLEPSPILPVPIEWLDALADEIRKVVLAGHRPIRGNPQNLMHGTTVEFARSIPEIEARRRAEILRRGLPNDSVSFKLWRTAVWEKPQEHGPDVRRMEITADEKRTKAEIKEKDGNFSSDFETLSPEFASRFGGKRCRWVNSIRVSQFSGDEIATLYPFNIFDRHWPRLTISGSESVTVSSEGWTFPQTHKNWNQYLTLESQEEAIIGALGQKGIQANLSDPGHIAKQMFSHLGGWWGLNLLRDEDTLKLLNKMAGGLRRKKNETDTVEETFERRTAPIKEWMDLIARRNQIHHSISIEDFTRRNVIRIGIESDCPHCRFVNWHSIAAADYSLTCERCLKIYEFPQGAMREHNRNWNYRVVGPFSVPDYARGAYGSLLALRFVHNFGLSSPTNFAPAMELSFNSTRAEVDFIAWKGDDGPFHQEEPELVIGEAKSFGTGDLITSRDLNKLKVIGEKLPGCAIIVAVLRDDFTSSEKKILAPFVKWGRRQDEDGGATNPIILLTGKELFFEHLISATWKELGGRYEKFGEYDHTKDLRSVADATQQIYLSMPSLLAQRRSERERWAKRRQRS